MTPNVKCALECAATVRKVAEKFGNKSLAGICSACSLALAAALQDKGIKAEIVLGYYGSPYARNFHVWVEVDGVIIDVTATQFRRNLRKVTVRKKGHRQYCAKERVDDLSGFLLRMHPVPRSVFFDMAGVKYGIDTLMSEPLTEMSER